VGTQPVPRFARGPPRFVALRSLHARFPTCFLLEIRPTKFSDNSTTSVGGDVAGDDQGGWSRRLLLPPQFENVTL